MNFITRNIVLIHIALLAAFLAWVHGGTRVDHLQAVPWLALLAVNFLLLLPPPRKHESLPDARSRVIGRLFRDPLLLVGIFLSILLVLQWANSGCPQLQDPITKQFLPGPPPWPGAPFSVDPEESRQQLFWFLPAFAAVLAVRHGVTRLGKHRLLLFLVWNGALLSLFGFIQNISGTHSLYWITPLPDYFFSTFGYPNVAGAFFTLLFTVSAGLWFHAAMDPEDRHSAFRLLVPVILNFAGAMGSLSRAAMLLSLLILAVGGLTCILAAWGRMQIGGRIQAVALPIVVSLLAIGLYVSFPKSHLRHELNNIQVDTFYHDTIGVRLFQYKSAWEMTQDHPFFGVGGWGYRHFVHAYVPEKELDHLKGGTANVHNDALQFLAEHGFIGFALMLSAVWFLLSPILRGVWALLTTHPVVDSENPYAPPLLRVPAVVFAILVGTAATVVHSMIDLPFRSPAVLMTWALCLACAPAYLPKVRSVGK
jgi:O-antigen ligase